MKLLLSKARPCYIRGPHPRMWRIGEVSEWIGYGDDFPSGVEGLCCDRADFVDGGDLVAEGVVVIPRRD